MSPTGSCVGTLGFQLLFGAVLEALVLSGDRAWLEEIGPRGRASLPDPTSCLLFPKWICNVTNQLPCSCCHVRYVRLYPPGAVNQNKSFPL